MSVIQGTNLDFGGKAKAIRMLVEGTPTNEQEIGYDAVNKKLIFHDGTEVKTLLTDGDSAAIGDMLKAGNGVSIDVNTGEILLGGTLNRHTSIAGDNTHNFTVVSVPQLSLSSTQSATLSSQQVSVSGDDIQLANNAGYGFALTGGETYHYGSTKGIRYQMANYNSLEADSLVPKGYVDNLVGASQKKYAETVTMTADTKVTITHSLGLTDIHDYSLKVVQTADGKRVEVSEVATDGNTIEFTPLTAGEVRVVIFA